MTHMHADNEQESILFVDGVHFKIQIQLAISARLINNSQLETIDNFISKQENNMFGKNLLQSAAICTVAHLAAICAVVPLAALFVTVVDGSAKYLHQSISYSSQQARQATEENNTNMNSEPHKFIPRQIKHIVDAVDAISLNAIDDDDHSNPVIDISP